MARAVRTNPADVRSPRLLRSLNVLLAATGLAAVASLVMVHGGFDPEKLPLSVTALELLQRCIVGVFILDRLLRLYLARRRLAYLKSNWLDYALIVLLGASLAVIYQSQRDLLSAGALYVIITQAYILAVLVLRAVGANLRLAGSGLPPSWLLIGSFAALALVGSGLLMLPAAVAQPYDAWNYPDALFTAVSATCVTGLVVADTGKDFTPFGQAVILAMIQLGGLGIMIFGTVLAILAGKALTVRSTEVLGEMLAHDRAGELARVVRFVVFTTILFELAGAILLYPLFARGLPIGEAVWHAAFHSISAFCNAGFALYTNNMMDPVGGEALRDSWRMLGVVAPLIVLGGLGFPVLQDLARYGRHLAGRIRRRFSRHPLPAGPKARLSLHSRIILTATGMLLVGGAVVLGLLELPAAPRCDHLLFQSVTARTAGFNTIDMAKLSNAGKLWMCGLMMIGGSPAGTAGGMKTATVALLALAAWCVLRRRNDLEAFGRRIPVMLLRRAITMVVLYLVLLMIVTLLLAVAMRDKPLIDLLFEACSACGTVGLSTGVTNRLDVFGKFVIIGGMFIGRIGPLTVLLALTAHVKKIDYSYPAESVVIG